MQKDLIGIKTLFVLLAATSFFYWWPKRRSFSIYILPYMVVFFKGGHDPTGFIRYSLMIFPIYLMFFEVLRKKALAYSLLLAGSAIGWTYFALQYLGGYTGG